MRATRSLPVFLDVPPTDEDGAAATTGAAGVSLPALAGTPSPPRGAAQRWSSSTPASRGARGASGSGAPPPRTSGTTTTSTAAYSVRSPSYVGPQNSHQASRPQSTIRPMSNAKAWYTNAEATNALRETWSEESAWHRQARIAQLETMARRRTESKRRAVERRELFPSKRLKEERDAATLHRTSYAAASSEIVFLPPLPAAREAALSSWAYDPIEMPSDELEAICREVADLKFTSVFEGFAMRRHASSKAAKKMLSKLLPNRGSAAAAAPPPAVVTEAARPGSLEPADLA